MGDRVCSEITIHKSSYKKHKKEIDALGWDDDNYDDGEDNVTLHDYEDNYGSLKDMCALCMEHNIEYDRSWSNGDNFDSGSEYARTINGEYYIHNIYDTGEAVVDELKLLWQHKEDPAKLIAELEKKLKELEPFELTPLRASNAIDFISSS